MVGLSGLHTDWRTARHVKCVCRIQSCSSHSAILAWRQTGPDRQQHRGRSFSRPVSSTLAYPPSSLSPSVWIWVLLSVHTKFFGCKLQWCFKLRSDFLLPNSYLSLLVKIIIFPLLGKKKRRKRSMKYLTELNWQWSCSEKTRTIEEQWIGKLDKIRQFIEASFGSCILLEIYFFKWVKASSRVRKTNTTSESVCLKICSNDSKQQIFL